MKSSAQVLGLSAFILASFATLASASSLDQATLVSPLTARDGKSAVYTRCKNDGDFALTFDDGPYKFNTEIVNELNQAGAIGTFFVNGNNYDCVYDKADELIAAHNAGHVIGSHTWTHADITKISADQLHDEIDHIEEALKRILGIRPRLFRPPYGNYNDEALEVLKSRGYSTILWSMDSGDSTGKSVSYSEEEYKKQGRNFPQPGIGLNHETYQSTADDVVPFAITELQKAGYKLVSVAECLGLEAYREVEGKTSRDESWHC